MNCEGLQVEDTQEVTAYIAELVKNTPLPVPTIFPKTERRYAHQAMSLLKISISRAEGTGRHGIG